MATYRKRGDRQWEARIRRKGYPDKSATFPTKQQAELWAQSIESQMVRKVYLDTSKAESTSVSELLERYQREVITQRENYSSDPSRIANLCRYFKDLPLINLTSECVATFRNDRLRCTIPEDASKATQKAIERQNIKEKRVGPASVTREMNILSAAVKHGMSEWGIFLPHGNPVSPVKRPKKEPSRERRPSEAELERLIESSDSPHLADICHLAVETAMRRGEIANIQWEDVKLTTRQLHIPKTKTGRPRTIPLSQEAVGILLRQLDAIQAIPESGYVFPLRADSITQAFTRAREKAAIDDLRFHDLRHEAASRFFEMGLDDMKVAKITGHRDWRSLERYTHLRPDGLANEIDIAKARLSSQKSVT